MKKKELIFVILIVTLGLAACFVILKMNKGEEPKVEENNSSVDILANREFRDPTVDTEYIVDTGMEAIDSEEYVKLNKEEILSIYGIDVSSEDFCVVQSTGEEFFEIALIKGNATEIKDKYIERVNDLREQYANDEEVLKLIDDVAIKSFNDYAMMVIFNKKSVLEIKMDAYF